MALQLFPDKYLTGALPAIKKSLRFSVLDACCWSVMFGLGEAFIGAFAVYYKASTVFISFMTAGAQLALFAGGMLSIYILRFFPDRRNTAIITNVFQGLTYIFLFWLTMITSHPIFILLFYVLGIFITTLAMSSWFTWMNDLVPENIRGTYWGGRNMYGTIAQVLALLVAGLLLTYFKGRHEDIIGFGILFTTASVFRILSGVALTRQQHFPMVVLREDEHISIFQFISNIRKNNLGKFVLFNILFTFSTNIMPPLIVVYLLKTINVTYWQFSVITMVFNISMAFSLPYWGRLADKFGNSRIFIFTTSLIPLLALAWALSRNFYEFIGIQLISGFLWAGSILSGQNFIIDNSSSRTLALNHPYFQSLNNLSMTAGSLLGGFLSILVMKIPFNSIFFVKFTNLRLELIFFLSFLLRVIVVLFFIKQIREVKQKPSLQGEPVEVFIFQPMQELANSFAPVAFIKKHYTRGIKDLTKILGRFRDKQ